MKPDVPATSPAGSPVPSSKEFSVPSSPSAPALAAISITFSPVFFLVLLLLADFTILGAGEKGAGRCGGAREA